MKIHYLMDKDHPAYQLISKLKIEGVSHHSDEEIDEGIVIDVLPGIESAKRIDMDEYVRQATESAVQATELQIRSELGLVDVQVIGVPEHPDMNELQNQITEQIVSIRDKRSYQ